MISSLRIIHYSDKSALVRDLVLPLRRHLAARPGVTAVWVRAHWLRGPQLVLSVAGTDEARAAAIADAADTARAWLAEHPSTDVIDAVAYEATSRELGRLELVEGPYVPLYLDNMVITDDDRLVDTFVRSDRAAEAKGRILSRGVEAVADVLDTATTPDAVTAAVYAGMAEVAITYPRHGLRSGYQAFLSHWKEYFHQMDGTGALEATVAAAYAAQCDDLVAAVRAALDEGTDDPAAVIWRTWARETMLVALDVAETGDVLPYPHRDRYEQATKFGEKTALQWSGSDDRDYSDYHRVFRQLDFTRLGNGSDFAAYRFTINSYFDLLPLLGISPLQRYAIAYFLTEATQEVLGERWHETLARTVENQRRDPDLVPTLPWRGEIDG